MKIRFSRAQMSIFVIISVIIVIGAIVLISFNSDSIHLFRDEKSSYKIEEFVESCLDTQTREAIFAIGVKGGWLYGAENLVYTDRSKPGLVNKNAKGLDFLEKNKIAYWYYYDDANEEFSINIPEYKTDHKYSLKNQVKRYLEENLDRNCIRSFENFEGIYEIDYKPRDIIGQIEVVFDEEDIIVSLDLPLEIRELASRESENIDYVDYFEVKKENKLWIPYHLALDIVQAESQSYFLEKRILGFLGPYQTIDNRDLLPPFYDFSINYDFRPWKVREVEKLTKQIISSNIGLIQFVNTDYESPEIPEGFEDSRFVRGFVNTYSKDYLSENSRFKESQESIFERFEDYKVDVIYNDFFPTNFNLQPSLGNVVLLPRPEAVVSFIPFFFTEYNAVYEMNLPILFEIRNSDYDDFVFSLALEANIDYNSPLGENANIDFDISELGLDESKSLICDPSQFISDIIYLNISDPVDYGRRNLGDPEIGVDGGIVTFDCKGMSECFIMETEINGRYISENITELAFRLPINCNPGTLEVYKFGHKKLTIENLNPKLGNEISLGKKYMPSKKTINLEIKLVESGHSPRSTGRMLTDHENAFLIFQSKEDSDIVEVVDVNSNNMYNLDVDLTLGEYNLQAFVVTNESFTIPEEKISYSSGPFSGDDEVTIPAIDFDSWVTGGIEIDFNVSVENLLKKNTITVVVTDFEIPTNFGELGSSSDVMSSIKENSQLPYFSNE